MKKKLIIILSCIVVISALVGCNLTQKLTTNKVENQITNKVVDYEEITITDFENAIETAAARVEKAVVGISLKEVTTTIGVSTSEDIISVGSGVIYKSIENRTENQLETYTYYVVTNRHVILDEKGRTNTKVYVYLGYEDKEIEAKVIAYDNKVDLACLTFEHTTYIQPVEFGNSDELKKGSFVIAVGNPEGFEYYGAVTFGVISGTNRYLATDTDQDGVTDFYGEYIQHDASINPGNSGGGLFTIEGKLVGINTLKIASEKVDNMGFAIPSNEVNILLTEYLEKKIPISRPRLGITGLQVRSLTPAIIASQNLKPIPDIYQANESPYGIYVVDIVKNGSIDGSNIEKDDIILTFDGEKILTMQSFSAQLNTLSKYSIGSQVELTYYSRSSRQIQTITITLKG